MTQVNFGKKFESSVEQSSSEQGVFYFRVRDVNLPPDVRMRVKLPQNKYDCLLFYHNYLFPIEMKSIEAKSISMDESMIKQHQIDNLLSAKEYEGVIPGFFFNFRLKKEKENKAYFVHIQDFIKYQEIAANQDHTYYISKINKSSIPIGICEEIGVEIQNVKKQVNYRYYINKLLDELIEKYS